MPGNEALAIFTECALAPRAGAAHAIMQNLAQAHAGHLSGILFVGVPRTFATFASSVVHMKQIKHFGIRTAGERESEVTTYLVAEPHVADVGLRLTKSGESIS